MELELAASVIAFCHRSLSTLIMHMHALIFYLLSIFIIQNCQCLNLGI